MTFTCGYVCWDVGALAPLVSPHPIVAKGSYVTHLREGDVELSSGRSGAVVTSLLVCPAD